MDSLKVCFVGIGSIAKRHIRNLSRICSEDGIRLTIDALRSRGGSLPKDTAGKVCHTYHSYGELPDDYDVVFITNPTDLHMETLRCVHDKSRHFFIEKPVTSYRKLEEVFTIPYRRDSVYYVACPLRYTDVIRYLKQNLDMADVISVRCISSSYLPDWRPGTDYRDTYSACKELGGGVGMDLVHEWDYIRYLFGKPSSIYYTAGKKSKLELDCEDYAVYVAEYQDKVIELHLDYFGRKTIREIMVFTNGDTIAGDLVHAKITYLKEGKEIVFPENRDDYQARELRYFLGLLEHPAGNGNHIMEAYQTLNYTRGIVKG